MKNKKEVFHLKKFEKAWGYAQAVKVGDTIHISGTVSIDDEGKPRAVGDIVQQTKNIYEDIQKTLKHYGLNFDAVIKESIYSTDLDLFTQNCIPTRAKFYEGYSLPASAAWIQVVKLAQPEFLVEIEAIALI